jgi:hypothetical protein
MWNYSPGSRKLSSGRFRAAARSPVHPGAGPSYMAAARAAAPQQLPRCNRVQRGGAAGWCRALERADKTLWSRATEGRRGPPQPPCVLPRPGRSPWLANRLYSRTNTKGQRLAIHAWSAPELSRVEELAQKDTCGAAGLGMEGRGESTVPDPDLTSRLSYMRFSLQ